MSYVIKTCDLSKAYGSKFAVNSVSINVGRGEIYGLIGKNGAGKTTLMKLILGLTSKKSGEINLFDGEDLNAARARIGSLIEAPGLFLNESAFGNLKKFAILTGSSDEEIKGILSDVGLANTGKTPARAFSLGMKQRLGIAIALLGSPELLVLDEPINGLDPEGIKEVRDMLLRLNERGVTILISSHLLDELGKIATKFGIMRSGELALEVTREEIEASCGVTFEITVDRADEAAEFIKGAFSIGAVAVREGKLFVSDDTHTSAELNMALASAGFAVSELKRESVELEDFFIKRCHMIR